MEIIRSYCIGCARFYLIETIALIELKKLILNFASKNRPYFLVKKVKNDTKQDKSLRKILPKIFNNR